jgi:hypothetical protein
LLRPHYVDYVNGMGLDKRSNWLDIVLMAKEGGLQVQVRNQDGEELQQVGFSKDMKTHVLCLNQKNKGHFYPLERNKAGEYVEVKGIKTGSDLACGLRSMLYLKQIQSGMNKKEAIAFVNRDKNVLDYLTMVKMSAMNDPDIKLEYKMCRFTDQENEIVGGGLQCRIEQMDNGKFLNKGFTSFHATKYSNPKERDPSKLVVKEAIVTELDKDQADDKMQRLFGLRDSLSGVVEV